MKKEVSSALEINYDDFHRFQTSAGFVMVLVSYIALVAALTTTVTFGGDFTCWQYVLLTAPLLAGIILFCKGRKGWKDRQEDKDEKLELELQKLKNEVDTETDEKERYGYEYNKKTEEKGEE